MQMNPYQTMYQPTYPQNNFYQPRYLQPQMPEQQIQAIQQPQMQQAQRNGLPGRCVNDEKDIIASEVPMDGGCAIFPKNDFSELYVKTWSNNGTISTIVFKPVLNENPNKLSNSEEKLKFDLSDDARKAIKEYTDTLFDKMEELEAKIDKSQSKTSVRSKANQGE